MILLLLLCMVSGSTSRTVQQMDATVAPPVERVQIRLLLQADALSIHQLL